ncbi:Inter-alpha-trypsin inhibitor domain protein [hydrothermal vent metagenome]|uniref:Inter-alpha-trypsin inhibitor domain protein n=1 Tax=hydrothermal vent metagenome TaxID=652676 RepID=A0A3B0XW99_9ZZZZ
MPPIYSYFFKRRPQREFLVDRYKPKKSRLVVFLQGFVFILMLLVLGIFILLLSNQAFANTPPADFQNMNIDNVSEGSLLVRTATPNQFKQIPLLKTDVLIDVSGMIARSHIKQYFTNTSKDYIEAIYVFPLPENAAVDHLRMRIGERIIKGVIKEKSAAKKLFDKAKREGKKAALVEQQRPNLFTNNVANIGPGETIVIEIEYQQVLHFEQGRFSLNFPMAITPRYIPGKPLNENISINGTGWAKNTDQVMDASFITPPIAPPSENINPVSIKINLNTGFPLKSLSSPYHKIIKHEKNNIMQIELASGTVKSDRDFELVWVPKINHAPKAALFSEEVNGDFYHLLMLSPPELKNHNGQALAREVTYVIDTSGSMYGASISQAKQALLMALDNLKLHDKFNIIEFNSVTSRLFSQAEFASFEMISRAKKYVKSLHADGGTRIAPALKLALNNAPEKNRVHQIIFLTDGSIGNESALFDIIHDRLGSSRLFTVGIGSAPNHYFMRKAAQFGRGSFTYIGDINDVNEKMSALFKKLESPLMTNIKLNFDAISEAQIWPKRIADLYSGEPLVLAIKSSEALHKINISGSRALSPWSATLNFKAQQSSKGIGTFWARQKISALSDSLHEGANKEQVRTDIIKVALNHHLVSKHTSLLAIDKTPSRPVNSKLKKKAVPVNLPRGQSTPHSFGRLAQTASFADLNLIMGFSLFMLFFALHILLRSKQYQPGESHG